MLNQQKISSQDKIEIILILVLLVAVLAAVVFAIAALATGNSSLWWGTGIAGGITLILRLHWTPTKTG